MLRGSQEADMQIQDMLLFLAVYGAIGFVIWKFCQALVRIGREIA